jgi:ethanolamine utilization microcompartment shell protein EutS
LEPWKAELNSGAVSYETGDLSRRSLSLERKFVARYCGQLLEIHEVQVVDDVVEEIVQYL